MQIPTLATLANGQALPSLVAAINSNFQIVANALGNTLDRYGSFPNQEQSNLDMNNFSIVNLSPPSTVSSPVRLEDIMNSIGIPANTYGLLNGSNIWTSTNAFTSHVIMGASVTAPSLQLNVIGGINTDTILISTASGLQIIGSGTGLTTFTSANSGASNFTITVPAATDTMVLLAATQTLTNKTLTSPAITGGSIQNTPIGSTTASTGAFTTLSASSTVSGTGFSTYLASPPAIGGTAPAAGKFTTLTTTGVAAVGAATNASYGLLATGPGATSGTYALVVQNATPSTIFAIRDDGISFFTGNVEPGSTNTYTLGGSSLVWSNVFAASFTAAPVLIANLPGSPTAGQRAVVSNGATSPTFLSTVSATGAVTAPVLYNGSNWVYC